MVALPLVCISYLQATPQQIGLLVAAETAPLLLLRIPAAAWADACARRVPVMVASSLLCGLLVAVIPLAFLGGFLRFWLVLGVGAAMAASSAVCGMFAAPTLPRIVTQGQLVDANGKFSVTRGIADIVGRSLAGMLISALSAPLAMVADAISFLFAAALTGGVREPPAESSSAKSAEGLRGLTRGVKEGAIDLVSISDAVPAEVKAKVDTVKAGLKDGSFVIWKGPIAGQDGKEVLAKDAVADDKFLGGINFYVKGVEGSIPSSK